MEAGMGHCGYRVKVVQFSSKLGGKEWWYDSGGVRIGEVDAKRR